MTTPAGAAPIPATSALHPPAGAQRLEARDVVVTLGGRRILDQVSLAVRPGELVALIGPNGAGKSTALAVLSGELAPDAGSVTLGGRDLAALSRTERARARAVLPQTTTVAFDYLVHDVVALGRTPWPRDPYQDAAVIASALQATGVAHLAGRTVTTLSGGERARASLSRVLAQTTGIVLLDEPTAALDIAHQESVLALARDLAEGGHGVLAVLHDLSLAAAWADRMVLLAGGRVVADGQPWQVCREDLLASVYEWPLRVVADELSGAPVVVPVRRAARV